jgi:hypothetical protein
LFVDTVLRFPVQMLSLVDLPPFSKTPKPGDVLSSLQLSTFNSF